ncbi:MAG: TonB-dependent receptor domain-containing protein [Ferrovibrio sp.]|uniref:TonB-dependent receptor domain-containing protein n=1 Tax=Ferrovibrio sp. TaxID=1917215 RepID=UPI00391D14F2
MSGGISALRRDQAALWGVSVLALVAGIGPAWGQQQPAATLPPVQVEGKKLAIEVEQAIDAEQIDRDQPTTLRELFFDNPAITATSGSTAAQKFYLHGLDQAKLNVTIDGAQQRNNVWHHNGNMTLDPLFLKSVEVESGVSAADSGPGALGGSVRFKTKDAKDMLLPGQTSGGTAILGYDTDSQTWRTTGAGYTAQSGFELLGIATLSRGDNYSNGDGTEEAGTGTDLMSGLAKLGHEAANGHRLRLSTEYAEDDATRRLRSNLGVLSNAQGRLLNSNRAVRSTTVLSYETAEPTDYVDPKFELYYNRNTLDRPWENKSQTSAHGDFNLVLASVGGKLQNTFVIPTGNLTVGVDYNRDDSEIERFHFTTNVGEEVTNLGAFVQARVSPLTDWRVSTGLRGDMQSYESVDNKTFDNSGLSPNLSSEYDLTNRITAFAGHSYNFGGLELAEQALFHAGNYTYANNLKPVTAHNSKLGLRYNDQGLALEGSLFRTAMENPVAYNFTTRTRLNGEDLVSRGFDLGAGYKWSNALVSAKYAHTDVKYGGRMALSSDYNTAVPVGDMFALRGEYTFVDYRLTLGASSEIALGIDDPALRAAGFNDIENYEVFNLYTEWQPMQEVKSWKLRFEVNNLFDEYYISRSTYGQTGTITPLYSPGRSVYLSSSIKF